MVYPYCLICNISDQRNLCQYVLQFIKGCNLPFKKFPPPHKIPIPTQTIPHPKISNESMFLRRDGIQPSKLLSQSHIVKPRVLPKSSLFAIPNHHSNAILCQSIKIHSNQFNTANITPQTRTSNYSLFVDWSIQRQVVARTYDLFPKCCVFIRKPSSPLE